MQLYAHLAPWPGLHLKPAPNGTQPLSVTPYLIPDPDAYFETRMPTDLWCHLGGGSQYNDMHYLYLHTLVLA